MTEQQTYQAAFDVDADHIGLRVDRFLGQMIPEYSRGLIQRWIKEGAVHVDGASVPSKHKLRLGEHVQVMAQLDLAHNTEVQPQAISLPIVYEDEAVLVINKPVGLVMHPGAGTPDGTLQNALLHHCPSLEAVPRAGIVHRLDKDTSGLCVVAKTLAAHTALVAQLQTREVSRRYDAVVFGLPIAGATIDEPIGRHPTERTKMAVVRNGREAISHYRVVEHFRGHSWVSVKLETGRTHQIRVHMSHRRMPLVGDRAYGGRLRLVKGMNADSHEAIRQFPRQALNASSLGFLHPSHGELCEFSVDLPADMQRLIEVLRVDKQEAKR